MDNINEHISNPMGNRGDFTRGIPFYGTKGDFNFTAGRSKFTPGVSIKQVPFIDMSVKGDPGVDDFDRSINKLKHFFKPGDRIRGILINSQFENEDGKLVIGKLHKITPDYTNNSIRAWIKDPKTLKIQEIYPETLEKIYESANRALSFSQFIGS